jgi:hypothetical protein
MMNRISASKRQFHSATKVAKEANSKKIYMLVGVAFLMLILVSEGLRLIMQSL